LDFSYPILLAPVVVAAVAAVPAVPAVEVAVAVAMAVDMEDKDNRLL